MNGVSHFQTKAYHFNKSFSQQCTATFRDISMPPSIQLVTNETLITTNIDKYLIPKLISISNPNKAHGHDGLSIYMFQKSSSFISKSLSIIFRNCLKILHYPHKGNNQILNIDRPIYRLFLLCGKFFEKIIFNTIFQYLTENDLLNSNQSGFMTGHSCIYQLISFTHKIYASFDPHPSLGG